MSSRLPGTRWGSAIRSSVDGKFSFRGVPMAVEQRSTTRFVVHHLRREDDAEVVAFLDQLAEASNGAMVLGYHYPENRDMLERVLQPDAHACYLVARSSATGQLQGVLPGFMKHSSGLSCY